MKRLLMSAAVILAFSLVIAGAAKADEARPQLLCMVQ